MKPITKLILCQHCEGEVNFGWTCKFISESQKCTTEGQFICNEPCTLQDYQICPFLGKDDKKERKN